MVEKVCIYIYIYYIFTLWQFTITEHQHVEWVKHFSPNGPCSRNDIHVLKDIESIVTIPMDPNTV